MPPRKRGARRWADIPAAELTPAQTELACDELARECGLTVIPFSEARQSRTICDVPDRRYRSSAWAMWFEVKKATRTGKLSKGQYAFLCAEFEADQFCAAGDAAVLRQCIEVMRDRDATPDERREFLWSTVLEVARRGFRSS